MPEIASRQHNLQSALYVSSSSKFRIHHSRFPPRHRHKRGLQDETTSCNGGAAAAAHGDNVFLTAENSARELNISLLLPHHQDEETGRMDDSNQPRNFATAVR